MNEYLGHRNSMIDNSWGLMRLIDQFDTDINNIIYVIYTQKIG